jgi:hypothetical protein
MEWPAAPGDAPEFRVTAITATRQRRAVQSIARATCGVYIVAAPGNQGKIFAIKQFMRTRWNR